jgi:hypothetical protein
MQIRQMQIANDNIQDRLVLRVSTQADEEFRVWLTRRFVREMWPHLAGLAGSQSTPVAGNTPPAQGPNFEQPFADANATYPLGMTPLLTSEVKCDTLSDCTFSLTFREGRERSFQLGLNADLLQALCAMLRAGAENAQWNLALDYAPAAPSPSTGTGPHSRLH